MHLAFGLGAGHLDLGLLHTDERRLSLVLKLIWRLASNRCLPRSLSVRLRAQRCATFARASVTASSKPSSDNLSRTRACWARFLSIALGRERGFFINPHSIVQVSNRPPSRTWARTNCPPLSADVYWTRVGRRRVAISQVFENIGAP